MYVEVIFFEKGMYKSREFYRGGKLEYFEAIDEHKNDSCLVCLRNAKHENIRQELLNYKVKKTK